MVPLAPYCLISTYRADLWERYGEIFTSACTDRTRQNGFKWKESGCRKFFIMMWHWNSVPEETVHGSSWEVFIQVGQGFVLDDFWRFLPNDTICDSAVLWISRVIHGHIEQYQVFHKMLSFCYVFNCSFANTSAIWCIQISSSLIILQNNLHFFFPGYCILITLLPSFCDNYVML